MRSSRVALLLLVAGLILSAVFAGNSQGRFAVGKQGPISYGDVQLYGDIAAQISKGQNYYEVATRLQRSNNYPVRPFYAVRTPVLAWAHAWFGDLIWPGLCLLLIAGLIWLHNLEKRHIVERMAALFCLLAAGLPLILSPFRVVHDMWGGLFATIALGLVATRLGVAAAFLAAIVRELNVPLLGLFAIERRTRNSALIALALCCVALALHREAVLSWTLPSDPVSQGWLGLRGPAAWVDDLSRFTVLQFLPRPIAAVLIFAPLLGWFELGRWRAIAWFGAVFALVTIFARPDNVYWCANALPAWFIGLAFVPAFLVGMAKHANRSAAWRA